MLTLKHDRPGILFATLDLAYPGPGHDLACRLVRSLLPRADHSFSLDITAEEAARRKPGDTIGLLAVRAQLESYGRTGELVPGRVVLDATAPPLVNAARVLEQLLAG